MAVVTVGMSGFSVLPISTLEPPERVMVLLCGEATINGASSTRLRFTARFTSPMSRMRSIDCRLTSANPAARLCAETCTLPATASAWVIGAF